MGSGSDGGGYESLDALLAVVIKGFAKRKTHTHVPSRTRTATVCNGRVVVTARDRRERGGRPPSSREAHPVCLPRPTFKASLRALRQMVWCGALVRVPSRAIAVVDHGVSYVH